MGEDGKINWEKKRNWNWEEAIERGRCESERMVGDGDGWCVQLQLEATCAVVQCNTKPTLSVLSQIQTSPTDIIALQNYQNHINPLFNNMSMRKREKPHVF